MDIFSLIRDGGPLIYGLLAVAVMAVTVIVEKFYVLFTYYHYDEHFFHGIIDLIRMNDLPQAQRICKRTDHPLAALIAHILDHSSETGEAIQVIAAFGLQKLSSLVQKHTIYVNMFAVVASLLGFLGSIYGLMISFYATNQATNIAKADALSKALVAVMPVAALGLAVAIPCVIAHTILSSQENNILQQYESTVGEVTYCLIKEAKEHLRSVDIA